MTTTNRVPALCSITSLDRLPKPVAITFAKHDGIEGRAYVMPDSFRLLVAGCNVAGIKGDVIVLGAFFDKDSVLKTSAWVVERDAWDPVDYPPKK